MRRLTFEEVEHFLIKSFYSGVNFSEIKNLGKLPKII